MLPQIIGLGEALVEVMRPGAGQPLDQLGEFRGPFASGAPAIFATAAARLDLPTGFIGCTGEDAFGRLLHRRMAAEGVDTRLLQYSRDHATGTAFVAYTQDGMREFVFHLRHSAASALEAGQLDPAYFSQARWLHLSGSTLALNPGSRSACQRALDLTLAAGGRLSFDPNLRPELMSLEEIRPVLAPYLQAADLLLPTAEEARALAGLEDEKDAAHALLAKGARLVVLKQGAAGCRMFTRTELLAVPGFAVEEIDPTGAGDCFNAACIAGLEAGWPLKRVGRFACAAGALAVTRLGPMEGAPGRKQVEALLQEKK